ncbi:MAG: DUF3256 family protein [Prevotella sp.]|nr:DUF3256 family protein [Prevotella sp.]
MAISTNPLAWLRSVQPRRAIALLLLLLPLTVGAQTVRDLWLSMPPSLAPYLSTSLRTQCLDFYDMHTDAQTDNALKGKSRIDTLTSTFLAATLSKAHTLQMKLLPASGSGSGSASASASGSGSALGSSLGSASGSSIGSASSMVSASGSSIGSGSSLVSASGSSIGSGSSLVSASGSSLGSGSASSSSLSSCDSVLCVVRSWDGPKRDSEVQLFDRQWKPLQAPLTFSADSFVCRPDTMSEERFSRLVALLDPIMFSVSLSPAENVLLVKLSPVVPNPEDEKAIEQILVQRKLKWDGKTFK